MKAAKGEPEAASTAKPTSNSKKSSAVFTWLKTVDLKYDLLGQSPDEAEADCKGDSESGGAKLSDGKAAEHKQGQGLPPAPPPTGSITEVSEQAATPRDNVCHAALLTTKEARFEIHQRRRVIILCFAPLPLFLRCSCPSCDSRKGCLLL